MKNTLILSLGIALSIACGDKSDETDTALDTNADGAVGTTDGTVEAETSGESGGTDTSGDDGAGTTGGEDGSDTSGGDDDTGTTGGDEGSDTSSSDETGGDGTGGDETGGDETGGDETGGDDDGDALRVGDELIIELPSNASTGYAWDLREPADSAIVDLESVTYVMDDAPDGMSGVGGTEVFRFRATGVGTTTIRLEYVQSWEPDDSADTHTQEVTVIE